MGNISAPMAWMKLFVPKFVFLRQSLVVILNVGIARFPFANVLTRISNVTWGDAFLGTKFVTKQLTAKMPQMNMSVFYTLEMIRRLTQELTEQLDVTRTIESAQKSIICAVPKLKLNATTRKTSVSMLLRWMGPPPTAMISHIYSSAITFLVPDHTNVKVPTAYQLTIYATVDKIVYQEKMNKNVAPT